MEADQVRTLGANLAVISIAIKDRTVEAVVLTSAQRCSSTVSLIPTIDCRSTYPDRRIGTGLATCRAGTALSRKAAVAAERVVCPWPRSLRRRHPTGTEANEG